MGGLADVTAVARMSATMCDRGPDGDGTWAQGPVALGHRRLKIIDLSGCGAQPMVDLSLAIVFNGCILRLPRTARGARRPRLPLFSTSDTEVLLKAYHRWGDRFVDRLKGMFGICMSTRLLAVGAIMTFARARVGAVVTRARADPLLACDGLDLLEEGYTAEEVLRRLVAQDHEPQRRQLIVVDAGCGVAVHTGTAADHTEQRCEARYELCRNRRRSRGSG